MISERNQEETEKRRDAIGWGWFTRQTAARGDARSPPSGCKAWKRRGRGFFFFLNLSIILTNAACTHTVKSKTVKKCVLIDITFGYVFFFYRFGGWKRQLQCGKMTQRWVRAEKQAGISGAAVRCGTRHLRSRFPFPQESHKWIYSRWNSQWTLPWFTQSTAGASQYKWSFTVSAESLLAYIYRLLFIYLIIWYFICTSTELEDINRISTAYIQKTDYTGY